jgi:hypothetical protein
MQTNEPNPTTAPATTDDTQSSADAADRRAFLKGAALVAGVAATGVLAAAPEANAASVRGKARAVLQLKFSKRQLTIENLHKALDDVLDQAGCPTCGLVGFDIHLEELILPFKSDFATVILEEGSFIP